MRAGLFFFFSFLGFARSWSNLNCPAPRAPENGFSFIFRNGAMVQYKCHPGYVMRGRAKAQCILNQWSEPSPECIPINGYQEFRSSTAFTQDHQSLVSPHENDQSGRTLFNWNHDQVTSSTTYSPYGDGPRRVPLINGLWRPSAHPDARVLTIAPPSEHSSPPINDALSSKLVREEVDIAELRHRQMEEVMKTRDYYTPALPEKKSKRKSRKNKKQQISNSVESTPAIEGVTIQAPDGSLLAFQFGSDLAKSKRNRQRHDGRKKRKKGEKVKKFYDAGPQVISRTSRVETVRRYPHGHEVAELRHRPIEEIRKKNATLVNRTLNDQVVSSPYSIHEFDVSCMQTLYGHEVPMIAPQIPHAYVYRYENRKNKSHPYNSYLQVKYRCLRGYAFEKSAANALYCRQEAWTGDLPKCVNESEP